jgi:hypothetical protein
MKKISNWDKVIKYVNNNPDATVREVATKVGISYNYAYTIMRSQKPKTKENTLFCRNNII